jgi:hypothetical protein
MITSILRFSKYYFALIPGFQIITTQFTFIPLSLLIHTLTMLLPFNLYLQQNEPSVPDFRELKYHKSSKKLILEREKLFYCILGGN